MNESIASFSNDTGFNDSMMHTFVCRNIGVNKPVKTNKLCVIFKYTTLLYLETHRPFKF